MPDFLLEIGCEEIPARMLDAARDELSRRIKDLAVRESLLEGTIADNPEHTADSAVAKSFATPRRLAVLIPGISDSQPDVTEKVLGPSVKVAFKDGKPTPAAEAFAKKTGVDVSKLEQVSNPKGEYLAATVTKKGRRASEVLAEALPKEIHAVYWAKNMYWRAGKPERFVRPVRWLVAMIGDDVIPLEFAGIKAARQTCGHRILNPGVLQISGPQEYQAVLAKAGVVASSGEREHRIRKALDAATRTVAGARWREDAELLKTVVNLTEWPSVILGNFEHQFLSLPEEVLVTVMRDHQKYFAVEDSSGKLAPHFLAVLNTDGDPDGLIRHGNERVLRARFNDARFFWDTDQKIPLKNRVEMLRAVTFQKELGSYYAKAERTTRLVDRLSAEINTAGFEVDHAAVKEAARLAKTDLTTELVKEFTELQGIVGGLYARAQGLPQVVANAIYDQYKPESVEDSVPRTREGAVLSLADKADSIAGMFALGMVPSGSKDPFALRRQANGIVKILAEHNLSVGLTGLLADALRGYEGSEAEGRFTHTGEVFKQPIYTFFRERLEFYLREVKNIAYDVVNATLSAGADDVVDALARATAVSKVRPSADFESISTSFKRMKNILRQAVEANRKIAQPFDPALLKEDAEKRLAGEMPQVAANVNSLRAAKHYEQALLEISRLRPAIDTFFDKVMVMVEDEELRAHRLGLLQTLVNEFSSIADFSEIVTERK
ncbi:MAG TPA: glycine--tRNA ligase subunit beta [Candidatus Dormibacteraeota bacterium]|jgi:glycyl-tRNA synthetase beta chain|nr:glycine--tRNA ligase subunit beta [Candidatus Dormibacteraeota bacterium]